jgi:hypothetical protein
MTRRRETGIEGDRGDRSIAVGELGARVVNPSLAQILSGRTTELPPERAREMYRVNAGIARERVEAGRISMLVVQSLANNLEPPRGRSCPGATELTRGTRDELESEAFDCHDRRVITHAELVPNSARYHLRDDARRNSGCPEYRACHAIARNPARLGGDDQTFRTARSVIVGMYNVSGAKQASIRAQLITPGRNPLR